MKPLRLLPSFLLLASVALAAAPARAQSASDKAAAEALFREGRRLLDAGQYPAACAKLAESQRLDPAPGTLLNLAGCYEKNGQTASAWATFKEAMAASHLKGRADWEDLARTRAAALEPTLSRLTINVSNMSAGSATADGLQVRRDGAAVGQAEWGTAIPVDPGTHVVEAQAPHRKPFRQSIDVAGGGASATVTVTDLAADDGAPGPAQTSDSGSTQRTIGLVVGGVGVIGLGVGSAFGLVAMSKENDAVHNHCPDQVHCDSTGLQLGRDAHTDATASTVFFAVGGAALVGGLVLYLTAPRGETAAPTVGLQAMPTRGGSSFGLVGTW